MPTFPLRLHLPLFAALLLLLWWALGYPALWDVPPSGVHLWRQADSASIAYNYVLHGMDFWRPRLHQLFDGDPHTVGEFPLFYYLAAHFGTVDAPPENALRTIHLLAFAAGLLALSRLVWRFTADRVWALLLPLLVASSPVIAYYAFNFLPDVPALGLVFVGWWGWFGYVRGGGTGRLVLGLSGFLLAGLLKPTAAVSLLAIIGVSIYQGWRKPTGAPRTFYLPLGFALVLLGYLAWNYWMYQYKAAHANTYFLAQIKPIWTAPPDSIRDTFSRLWQLWLPDYGHFTLHGLTLAAAVSIAFRLRNGAERLFLALLALGVLSIFVLFFRQYHHHDYYYVALYVWPVALLVWGTKVLPPRWRSHGLVRLVLLLVVLVNTNHARQIIAYRSAPGSKYMGRFNYDLHDRAALQAFLTDIGVPRDAKVISLPDNSPSNTLYFLDRPGWTRFRLRPFAAAAIRSRIALGAEYLLITRKGYLTEPAVQPFLGQPIGDFRGSVFVYRLEGEER